MFTVNFSSSFIIRFFVPWSFSFNDFRGINSSTLMNSWPLVLVFDKLKLISSKRCTFERHDLTTSSTVDLLNALLSFNTNSLSGFGVVLSDLLLVSSLINPMKVSIYALKSNKMVINWNIYMMLKARTSFSRLRYMQRILIRI